MVKRFIAGAVCPRCGEEDKIRMYEEDGAKVRECVNCDFTDKNSFITTPRELDTRVNRSEEDKSSEIQVLNLPESE